MSNNINKKELANRIKADLKKELEGGDLAEFSDYGLVADNGNIFAINEYFLCQLKHNIFKPNEFEKEDYDEIVSLIKKRLQLKDQALAAERAKKTAKLDSNPKLFYHSGCRRDKAGA